MRREGRRRGTRARVGAAGLVVLAAAAAAAGAQEVERPSEEPVCLVSVLRNGDLAATLNPAIDGVPWWSVRGHAEVVAGPDGPELHLSGPDARALQAVPAYAPLVRDVVVRGRVRGAGGLRVHAGGAAATEELRADPGAHLDFELVLGRMEALGPEPRPRLALELSAGDGPGARWSRLEVLAPLPCPSEDALRAEVAGHLERIFDTVLAACLDDVGARATPFPAFDFDVDRGTRIEPAFPRVGDVSFHLLLLRAWRAAPRPEWEAALAEFLAAYLELCLHPDTGLERRWDPRADRPLDEPVQLHLGLAFLLDVAEHGPEPLRERALAAAERMARGVLAHGVLADGEVAASYHPATGAPDFEVPHLRRLDVPAQLARVAARTADAELARACRAAAEQACLTLAYDHTWPGDWASIDPGFDDNYGHYGARAAVMWAAHPGDEAFRSLVSSGWRRYAPLWGDALRYGGNVAADQVRCWRIAVRVAELAPEHALEAAELLDAAVHAHLLGEQVPGGAWIDVTSRNFTPVALPVGDTGGVPQNLLEGLGIAYGARELGLATDANRARFAAVLRTSVAEFGREHGFALQRRAPPGAGGAGFAASRRVAAGLVEMLESLAR
jgi:hypothetical protein